MAADDIYLRDLAFSNDFVLSPKGDLDTRTGLDNLRDAIYRRIVTVPGSIVHRPDYGVGLPLYVGSLNSLGRQQKLAAIIKEQLERDDRVEEFLSLRVEQSSSVEGMVKITVRVKPVGYTEQAITIQSGGI
jgi:phage baseplate assembly protein W